MRKKVILPGVRGLIKRIIDLGCVQVTACYVALWCVSAPLLAASSAGQVTGTRIISSDKEPSQWLSHGRTYSEQRFSPLARINDKNINDLGLAWQFQTDSKRGLEATPIFADGVLYFTGTWSVVFAVDARTGKELWRWDPKVDRSWARNLCCDVVNRGVAVWKGRVYVGTLDGKLAALDASNGEVIWEVLTIDKSKPYSITGAPRVVKDKVIIGNGGAELGVRGYFSAYDTNTGKMVWRFYTVPGDPAKPVESKALEAALPTWKGGEWWKVGGGGTVWDSMAYDPELDLLYVGTGNGSPWSRAVRSPGGGDNLYLSSILAVRPDTGELVWHYQTTPGDSWDFTATQHIVLAELEIEGKIRKVLMQAPKNGFFYVLDRETGELISAEKYVNVIWAEKVDLKTGRPLERPGIHYQAKGSIAKIAPTSMGGHNWQPMSFNPEAGLVYIPSNEAASKFSLEPEGFQYDPKGYNLGTTTMRDRKDVPEGAIRSFLDAWDPVKQSRAWRVPLSRAYNGGILSTAGNLVFQGTADGKFVAYQANSGTQLWSFDAPTGILAAPITYEIDGVQYVSVLAGWGGGFPLLTGGSEARAAGITHNSGSLLTFRLNGSAQIASVPWVNKELTDLSGIEINHSSETIDKGKVLFDTNCSVCHGVEAISGGVTPDLRYSSVAIRSLFSKIVLEGLLESAGMPRFADKLSADDAASIRAYLDARVIDTGHKR